MFSRILKKLRVIKPVPECITFQSSVLKENSLIWNFLLDKSTDIGGKLQDIILETQSGSNFELQLAGGTITIPAGFDCDFNLFNHFKEYFEVDFKIPLFLYHSIGNNEINTFTKILDDYEVFNNIFCHSDKPQVIAYFSFGPNLCWGRHSRWRAQFDIYKPDKSTVVTNHACHDWGSRDRLICNLGKIEEGSKLIVVSGSPKADEIKGVPLLKSAQEFQKRDLQFKLANGNAFNFIETQHGNLSGNHIIQSSKQSRLRLDQYNELKLFDKDEVIYNPYVMPQNTSDVEFGMFWPLEYGKVNLCYQIDSGPINEVQLDSFHQTLFRSEITDSSSDLVLWQKYPENISDTYDMNQPMLVCRNIKSMDSDFTEFQSCWRNQGFESKIFPHWLGNFKALKPSSRLSGILNFDFFDAGLLFLQALYPKGCKSINGSVVISIFNDSGQQLDVLEEIISNSKCIQFKFEKEKYQSRVIALRIRSTNIDFTANLAQFSKSGATSLQHLWGY